MKRKVSLLALALSISLPLSSLAIDSPTLEKVPFYEVIGTVHAPLVEEGKAYIKNIDPYVLEALWRMGVKVSFLSGPVTDVPSLSELKGKKSEKLAKVHPIGTYDYAGGIYMDGMKQAYVRVENGWGKTTITLHELGHAFMNGIIFALVDVTLLGDLAQAEGKNLFADPYATNYGDEYFAEYFAHYFAFPEQRETMRLKTPKTFQYLQSLLERKDEWLQLADVNLTQLASEQTVLTGSSEKATVVKVTVNGTVYEVNCDDGLFSVPLVKPLQIGDEIKLEARSQFLADVIAKEKRYVVQQEQLESIERTWKVSPLYSNDQVQWTKKMMNKWSPQLWDYFWRRGIEVHIAKQDDSTSPHIYIQPSLTEKGVYYRIIYHILRNVNFFIDWQLIKELKQRYPVIYGYSYEKEEAWSYLYEIVTQYKMNGHFSRDYPALFEAARAFDQRVMEAIQSDESYLYMSSVNNKERIMGVEKPLGLAIIVQDEKGNRLQVGQEKNDSDILLPESFQASKRLTIKVPTPFLDGLPPLNIQFDIEDVIAPKRPTVTVKRGSAMIRGHAHERADVYIKAHNRTWMTRSDSAGRFQLQLRRPLAKGEDVAVYTVDEAENKSAVVRIKVK